MSQSEVAAKLLSEGPVKQEPAKRRVRGLLSGTWVFDTLEAQFVWEHPYYPVYYVPVADLTSGPGRITKDDRQAEAFWVGTLRAGQGSAKLTGFTKGPLEGLVKISPKDIEWFAEDEKLLGGHPKDPYKRIECLPSSREVRIEVNGTVVAQSTNNIFLHETMLRTRYYLTPISIKDWGMLAPSNTTSFCPYKGEASYYHLKVGDTEIKDAVWYYVYPTAESAAIQGRLCFYNEKVDVFVDGVKEQS